MIITLKKNAPKHDIDKLINTFEKMKLQVTMIQGDNYNVFGLVGDTSIVDEKSVLANPIVYNVQRVAQPYKLANRMFHPEDTIVDVNGIKIGGKKITMIAGPCSVEGEDQICRIAKEVKEAGADKAVLTMKSFDTLAKVSEGSATKIIIPSELQTVATMSTTIGELLKEDKKDKK